MSIFFFHYYYSQISFFICISRRTHPYLFQIHIASVVIIYFGTKLTTLPRVTAWLWKEYKTRRRRNSIT